MDNILTDNFTRTRHARPRAEEKPATAEKRMEGKRVAVLLYSSYPSDPRPRRAAHALVEEGAELDLFCLGDRREGGEEDGIEGMRVFRQPLKKRRDTRMTYLLQYGLFLAYCFVQLLKRFPTRRYDVIHVHNMPDILVFSAILPKLFGAKVVLDLHDPMPELMMSIYGLRDNSLMVRMLKLTERASIAFADLVVTPNKAFRERFVERGCPEEKIAIVMNSPEGSIFRPPADVPEHSRNRPAEPKEPFRIMHHGFLAERHGLDVALRAIAALRGKLPGVELHIYGARTPYAEEMEALAEELELEGSFHYHGYRNQKEIAAAIAGSDVGIIPNRRNPFTEINLPTRIFEYLALGKPVVVPNTSGIRDYFQSDSVHYFEPDDEKDLAEVLSRISQNPAGAAGVARRGRAVYLKHRWEEEREQFVERLRALLEEKKTGAAGKRRHSSHAEE